MGFPKGYTPRSFAKREILSEINNIAYRDYQEQGLTQGEEKVFKEQVEKVKEMLSRKWGE